MPSVGDLVINEWPPCRAVADQETTHRILTVTEHQRFAGGLDPMVWWTVCGIQMRSTRRSPVRFDKDIERADVLPPSRPVTCLRCLAGEP